MALEDQLWRIARDHLARGEALVVCTVVESRGSTPREVGTRLLFGPEGLIAGTVGGGCGEAEVLVSAHKVQKGFINGAVVEVDLSGDLDQDEVQVCGGVMRVSVEALKDTDSEMLARLADAEATREPVTVVMRLPFKGDGGERLVLTESASGKGIPDEIVRAARLEQPSLVAAGEAEWFVQRIGTLEELVIVGSGHVAQPLARIAAILGYRVVVIDDRSNYANSKRFPDASRVLVGEHAQLLAEHGPGPHSSVVIITRGHKHDQASLREVLNHSPRYVGMIASRRRAIGTLKRLKEDGIGEDKLSLIHSPIGLDIGAQTPEEIAVAIMSEVIRARAGGTGAPLKDSRPGSI